MSKSGFIDGDPFAQWLELASAPLQWRALSPQEISALENFGNEAEDWTDIRVAEDFDPSRVRNCRFSGHVRIDGWDSPALEIEGMTHKTGLYDSRVTDCVIGRNSVVDHVSSLSRTIVGNGTLLLNIGEISCPKPPQAFEVEVWNENGGRRILAVEGMLTADALLWARYRDDRELLERLEAISRTRFPQYSIIGPQSVFQHVQRARSVRIGPAAEISGAFLLENVMASSRPEAPVRIGEGVILRNAVLGEGCSVSSAAQGENVLLCPHSKLKSAARVTHTVVGDNSQIYCCEILSALIFPFHVQHHNNSFLISSCIEGQSNLAAGATIGSNHNSRAFDGELHARRGFWPGLCVSLKHNSRFASFTLIAKGTYPAELDIRLPYSLVSNDEAHGRLTIMPAYWALYNFYALARHSYKISRRDARIDKPLEIELDYLAPDTLEEMFDAMALLETWTARAALKDPDFTNNAPGSDEQLRELGRTLLLENAPSTQSLEVLGEHVERSSRPVVILKCPQAYRAYRELIHVYATRTIVKWMKRSGAKSIAEVISSLEGSKRCEWVNLGGQLATAEDVAQLRRRIAGGTLADWSSIHGAYGELARDYPRQKSRYALAALLELHCLTPESLSEAQWGEWMREAAQAALRWAEAVRNSRGKDFEDPFRMMAYQNEAEMRAVLGSVDDDAFIRLMQQDAEGFAQYVEENAP